MNKKNQKQYLAIVALLLATFILTGVIFQKSYRGYQQEVVQKEQDQLLTMARTIGKSLVNYIDQELDSIDLYFETLENQMPVDTEKIAEKTSDELTEIITILSDFTSRKPDLYEAASCYDENGRLLTTLGELDFQDSFEQKQQQAYICGKRQNKDNWYQLLIARTFQKGGKQYTALFALNLDTVYHQIVAPVRIGRGGYSVVKDSDLTIIMHHAQSQVGIDALYDRTQMYPQLDLSDLESWIHTQETQPEGMAVIRSYVWDQQEPTPEKRIIAYTTIDMPGEKWIVNSTLPYQELDKPLEEMMRRVILMGTLFLTIMLLFEYSVIRGVMRAMSQKKEIEYLREINEGMILLRRKEEEIQHYQRVQSIGEMSSHIAHEFNNYLTPIMVYSELLETDPEITPSQKEMAGEILSVAEQAAGLSRRLLDFSRQDTSIVLESINFTQELRKACSMVRQLTPAKVKFIEEIPDNTLQEACIVTGRKGMLEHILMNLCNNAFHAMEKNPAGILKITLRTSLTEEEVQRFPNHICLQVADNGCGISEDARKHIFEPFYTTKRSGKGTGLGLSVVQNIMTSCGGDILVDSKLGEGTVFSLYFPKAAETKPENGRVELNMGKRTVRILAIDDDPLLLKSLETKFTRQGISAAFYDHPAAGLARIQNETDFCEILLTDYDMPTMNGLELAEIVRRLNPQIRIILMSGLDEQQFEWYLKNKIIDEFIPKTEIFNKEW